MNSINTVPMLFRIFVVIIINDDLAYRFVYMAYNTIITMYHIFNFIFFRLKVNDAFINIFQYFDIKFSHKKQNEKKKLYENVVIHKYDKRWFDLVLNQWWCWIIDMETIYFFFYCNLNRNKNLNKIRINADSLISRRIKLGW